MGYQSNKNGMPPGAQPPPPETGPGDADPRVIPPGSVRPARAMTPRVFVLAALLVPLHAYWIIKTEVVWSFVHATVLSAFFNVLATMFALVLINRSIARRAPRFALSTAEMVGLYVLLCAATAVFGHDFLQVLTTLLVYPRWQAITHDGWGAAYLSSLPTWLTISDPAALRGVWLGNASPYHVAVLRAWAAPLSTWLAFMLSLIWTMLCLTTLLRRRWTEQERLSFPLVQIPIELLCRHERLLSSRPFWTAFILAGGLDLWNAAANVYPSIPPLNMRADLAPYLTQSPWNAMGGVPVCVYPFAIGLAYFMPLDLAFSTWFFYWLWKSQMVVLRLLGADPLSGQYLGDQSSGAWLGIGLLALWGARHYLADIVRKACSRTKIPPQDDEPMPDRTALLGLILGVCLLGLFAWAIGLSLGVAAIFFALFLVFCAAVTRMRAELGPITHDLYFSGPERVMTVTAGASRYTARDLTLLSQFHWITRDFRSSQMPHQLEGYKLGQEAGARLRGFVAPILLISAWAFIAWFACYLHVMYDRGLTGRVGPSHGWVFLAQESYTRLDAWLSPSGSAPEPRVCTQMGVGLAVTALLMALHQRFIWFPLHPVGYALAGSWTMSWLWCSVMIGWLLKGLLLRYGGVRNYRRAAPFFVGLVLGEFVAGGGLSLLNALTDRITYGFFP